MQTEQNEQQVAIPVSPEEQRIANKKFTTQRAKILSTLSRAHIADFLNTLAFQPGLSGERKAEMIVKFCNMVEGVLDFGVDVTKIQVPGNGNVGKKTANIGAVLAQAIDNKMILLAQNLEEAELNNAIESQIDSNSGTETTEVLDTESSGVN